MKKPIFVMHVGYCSAFDVKAPCVGEFASYCFKEHGSAGLSQEDSGKNGDETVLSYAWVQLDQAESHMIEMCRVWQCDSGNSSKCLQKVLSSDMA